MQDLFRRSALLLRNHPLLWLPASIAAIAQTFLFQLKRPLLLAVLNTFFVRHSVLSTTPLPADFESSADSIFLAIAPLMIVFYLLSLFFYSSAMIAISFLIPRLISEEPTSLRQVFSAIRRSARHLILFVFTALMYLGIAELFSYFALTKILSRSTGLPRFGSWVVPPYYVGYTLSFVLFSVAIYLLAPQAVALLRLREAVPIWRGAVRCARVGAVLTALASVGLWLLGVHIAQELIVSATPIAGVYAIQVAESIVSTVPYTFLFIVLSLLASEGTLCATTSDDQRMSEPRPTDAS